MAQGMSSKLSVLCAQSKHHHLFFHLCTALIIKKYIKFQHEFNINNKKTFETELDQTYRPVIECSCPQIQNQTLGPYPN
jgi:hypothetical protein